MSDQSSVATLVPNKSDYDLAAEIKKNITKAYESVIPALQDAHDKGFIVNASVGISQFGQVHIQNIQLLKEFK